jgi:hypothetical protein
LESGYAFASERDLQARLETLDFLQDDAADAVYFRREVPVGKVIPDLVCIRFNRLPELNIRNSRWSFRHAYLLWLLRRRNRLTLLSLARLTYDRQDKVELLVKDLLHSGTIVQLPTGSFALSRQFASLQAEVIAVEAKLDRWNEALQQARKYQRFADRVFVAMDYERIKTKRVPIPEFIQSGVGLLGVSKTCTRFLNRGRRYRSASPEWEYLVSSTLTNNRQALWVRR